jgi:hypothetical protein
MPSRYEDELWRELVDKHGEEPEGEHPPAPPWRPRGRWAAAGGAVLVAAAATGGVLAYSAISAPTPAYAVTRNHDGSVRIYLSRTSGIKGLNARLKAMNVQAQAVLVAGGCPAPQALVAASLHARRSQLSWSVRPHTVVRPTATQAAIHILLVRRARHGVSVSNVVGRAGVPVPACVDQVPVATRANGRDWKTVVVGPMTLTPAPGPCAVPSRGASTNTTSGATTTTGATTTSGGTTTTPATNFQTVTSGETNTQPPVAVWCCKHVVVSGTGTNTGTATSGATTSSGATTTTGETSATATSGGTGTTGTPPPGPACRTMEFRRVHVVQPGTATSTGTATTAAPAATARQKSKKH